MDISKHVARLLQIGLVAVVAAGCARGTQAPAGPNPERVQVGYGELKGGEVTGAVSSLAPRDLENQPYSRLGEMLEGRVPGLIVTRRGDGGYTLRIRGVTSMTGSNEPLVVVDGLALNQGASRALDAINPRDVQRIDVLKGPEASIYGSRGANGVVVITTKRGR